MIDLNVNSVTIEFIEMPILQIVFPKNAEYQDADLRITKSLKKELIKLEKQ